MEKKIENKLKWKALRMFRRMWDPESEEITCNISIVAELTLPTTQAMKSGAQNLNKSGHGTSLNPKAEQYPPYPLLSSFPVV